MVSSVGIVGIDYCGSTLINNILSGLPGCIGVGESHWIIDADEHKTQTGLCKSCWIHPCPVFSEELLEKLRGDESLSGWWERIGEAAGVDVVVTGDKDPVHYERLGVPDKLLMVVKDPRSHIVSWWARKYPPGDGSDVDAYQRGEVADGLSENQFTEGLEHWIRETHRNLEWSLGSGKEMAVVSLESLSFDDEAVLTAIAHWMGVAEDANALKFWETDLHYIGGNHDVKRMKKNRYFFKTIKLDERWKQVLSDEQANRIMDDERVIELLERLHALLLGTEEWSFTTGSD